MNRNTLLISVGFMAVFALAITITDMINTTGNKVGLLLAEAQQLASGVTVGNNTTMGSSVTVGNNTTMGSSVTIGDNTTLGSSVTVGNNASIAENTRIAQSASIADNTRVSQGASIAENAKIGRGANIGVRASIGAGASIGGGANIADGVNVGGGASIGENTRIAQGAIIGGGASIAQGASIAEKTRIADGANIGGGANIGENVAATGGGGQISSNASVPQPSPGEQNLTAQATPINIATAVATPSSAACDDDGTVTLEGTVSPMVPITARWEQTGGEPDVDIIGSGALISTFAVPACDEIDGDTTLTFRLTVIDGRGITDVASADFVVTEAAAAEDEEG